MCQACVDNECLSQTTSDAIQKFLEKWPNAEFGPAHIVLSDYNLGDGHIRWCLELIHSVMRERRDGPHSGECLTERDYAMLKGLDWYSDHPNDELSETVEMLEKLLFIPECDR